MSAKLNGILEDISAEVGFTAATTLAAWYAGSNLYVPAKVDADHHLVKLIGQSAANRLVLAFGSETLWLPEGRPDETARRDRLIAQSIKEGKGAKTISEMTGLTQRHVNRIRAGLEARGLLPLILKNQPQKSL